MRPRRRAEPGSIRPIEPDRESLYRSALRELQVPDADAVRIVVADDSVAIRLLVRITVESEGWSVVDAPTGAVVLALIRERLPDLLLLDLGLGPSGPDGLAVLRMVRAAIATAALPVVILTAADRPDVRTEALDLGANEFLTKPFGPLDLITTMRAVLGRTWGEPRLGLHLVQTGALAPDDLRTALTRQRERDHHGEHVALGALLVGLGMISTVDLEAALRRQELHGRIQDGAL